LYHFNERFGIIKENEHDIFFKKNERRTNSPKWCVSTFKLVEETEVDQEERGGPDTHEDEKNLKRLTN
jgi:hypothetical protein